MSRQLLGPEPADPENDDQEQEPGRRAAVNLTALWDLRESHTDVESPISWSNACTSSGRQSPWRPT
ncbi:MULTISPECIES: hypothetical protein [unclassified Streptomyces]|uniref:hypothetical protein n=1 Tax=unclassified Streptomyces TaxID=2593676 RepID=UPI002E2E5C3F|nr:hypothetical protein [Streptomyces sp. NBC_00334]